MGSTNGDEWLLVDKSRRVSGKGNRSLNLQLKGGLGWNKNSKSDIKCPGFHLLREYGEKIHLQGDTCIFIPGGDSPPPDIRDLRMATAATIGGIMRCWLSLRASV